MTITSPVTDYKRSRATTYVVTPMAVVPCIDMFWLPAELFYPKIQN